MSEYCKAFGEEMEALRISLDMNISNFARAIGIGREQFYFYREGKRKSVRLDSLRTLLDLGLSLESIVSGEETTKEFINRIFNSDDKALSKICKQSICSLLERS